MNECMTHPDILRLERDGLPEVEPEPVLHCEICGEGIYEGGHYYLTEIYKIVYCTECYEENYSHIA